MNFQHLLTLFTGLIECMFFAGITFGWASLVFVLKNEKYFQDLCPSSGNQSINATISCPEQDEQFSIIFIIAAFMNNFMTLPCGFVYDKFGTLITRFLAIFIFTCGTLLIALSTADTAVILFPALSLLTTGGILLMMTNIQVGNLFGSHRSTVITFYNGAFDSSSVVFLIVKVGYQKGASLQTIFICIASCFVWHIIRTLFLMPKAYIPYPLPEDYSYGLHCKKTYQKTSLDPTTANDEVGTDRQEHDASGISFWRCACSSLFIWHVVWLSLMQLRHYMFIATLNPTLSRLSGGDPQIVSYYTNVFALSQCCGILCAPWNGILIDRHKRKQNVSDSQADLRSCVVSLALTATQCLLFSISATIPILPVLYATFILQVLNRSFLYGGNAAFLSIAFPTQHFGKLFGLTMSLSALILVFQYPTFYILRTYLNGDPFYVNIALLILGLLVFIHPINVFRLCRKKDVSKE